MKYCCGCEQSKPIVEFRKRSNSKDGLASRCKNCADIGAEDWRQRNLQKRKTQSAALVRATQIKFNEWRQNKGCLCCGENTPVCLDLHHLDPSMKEGNPSKFVKYGWKRLMEEAEKCVVVCRNCHAKIHAGLIKVE
jgi:hypothetical protein